MSNVWTHQNDCHQCDTQNDCHQCDTLPSFQEHVLQILAAFTMIKTSESSSSLFILQMKDYFEQTSTRYWRSRGLMRSATQDWQSCPIVSRNSTNISGKWNRHSLAKEASWHRKAVVASASRRLDCEWLTWAICRHWKDNKEATVTLKLTSLKPAGHAPSEGMRKDSKLC